MRTLAALLAGVLLWATALPLTAQDAPRVITIGNIYGAINEFKASPNTAGLTGADGQWTGGRALALLGHHEAMNLIGDTPDVTREIFATFPDGQSDARRQAAWSQYAAIGAARLAKGESVPVVHDQTHEAWLTTHPPGFVEYREALSPHGRDGAWLREKDMVTLYCGPMFMHAAGDAAR